MTDVELKPLQTPTSESRSLKVVCKSNHSKLARLVTLVSNMKKSPWLLSRCKESPSHIQALIDILQPEDSITVAVKLESPVPSLTGSSSSSSSWSRYLVVASTGDKHVVQESVLLGVDVVEENVTLGLVLPIYNDMDIQMDGDGGFDIVTTSEKYSFRPVSVQAMWSALQSLVKAVYYARYHHQYREKSSHGWVSYYVDHLTSSRDCIYEWNRIMSGEFEKQIQGVDSTEDLKLKLAIKRKLRDVMTNEKDIDLETVTSKYLREKLEAMLNVSLASFRRFVDEEMVIVMRQMDSPSQILDYLYLGSEWNASNLEELQQNKIGYILNVTREIDNFFPGMFKYCNVRVDDTEETQLLRHWNDTFSFIAQAKKNNSRILVHCKMGVSRSASTVIAYVMKECGRAFLDTYQYVKQKRNCVKPNPGFMQQLNTYEGILGASKHRHSKLFRSRSAENLDNGKREIEDHDESFAAKRSKFEEKSETDDKKPEVLSTNSDVDVCDSVDSRSRPATFSIDSQDALSPGSLPIITELEKDDDQPGVNRLNLDDVLEDEVLCAPGECGVEAVSMALIPMAVLCDPSIPLSSMLRKLSFQTDTGDLEGDGRMHGRESQPAGKNLRESKLRSFQVRPRSSSWPMRSKDCYQSSTKITDLSDLIRRPNAKKHRKLRGQRSNTIAVDD